MFRQKTKAELIDNTANDYARTVLHYIHHNPLHAKLINDLKDWEYSSYKDYAGLRNGNLINKDLAKKVIDINWAHFEKETIEAYKNRM